MSSTTKLTFCIEKHTSEGCNFSDLDSLKGLGLRVQEFRV